ncbi:hypothetical protein HpBT031_10230 [Helicobacter pylori]
MNALKKLSFCTLLSLGLFAQTVHANSLKDTINYPDWLKINLFDKKTRPINMSDRLQFLVKGTIFIPTTSPMMTNCPLKRTLKKWLF